MKKDKQKFVVCVGLSEMKSYHVMGQPADYIYWAGTESKKQGPSNFEN